MAVFRCKMCGGTLEFEPGAAIGVCEYCGTKQTLPRLDDDRRANLYDRANHYRRNNEYDKAAQIYETILNEDNTDAEAYWSLVLCRYGVEYVEDPATHKRVPTVNRTQFTSIFDDDNYRSAIRLADGERRAIYEAEAAAINGIQKGILAISEKEKPFDVFICYKETDNNGRRTPDSVLAYDLYHQLTQEGFKVFFARVTLEDKLGAAYEPYIFAALNSAKVMVVLGTKPEYFNAVWVKNEWSRYLSLVKQSGGKKALIPAYKDMDPYDLPEEFSHLQAQDMSKLGFMQDLIRGIKKIAKADEPKATVKETVVVGTGNSNVAPLLKRAFLFLEDGDWEKADNYCEQVLNQDPENGEAYLGKMMAELRVRKRENLADVKTSFDRNANYQKAARFGDETLNAELDGYLDRIRARKHKKQTRERVEMNEEEKAARRQSKKKRNRIILLISSGVALLGIVFCILWFATPAWTLKYVSNDDGGFTVAGVNKKFVKSVKIPEKHLGKPVTSIGFFAFEDCSGLKSVTIPDSVTSVEDGAFYGCFGLTAVYYTGGVSGWCGIAFESYNANPLEYAHNLYINDELVIDLVISDGITSIGNYAFFGCSGLTSVTIPDCVTSIGDSAFSGCSGLTSVTIPDSVTSIGNYAFSNCSGLKTLVIGNGVSSLSSGLLQGCSSLESITIPFVGGSRKTASDTYQYPFGYIFGTGSYTGGKSTTQYYYGSSTSSTTGTTYDIPSSLKSVTVTGGEIIYGAFYNCSGLTSVTIPDSVTSIGESAFNGCSGLTSIAIPDSVTSIGYEAFSRCFGLTSVTIPNSVTSIGESAFYGCYCLVEVRNLSALSIVAGSYDNGEVGYYAKRVYSSGDSYLHTTDDGYIFYEDGDKVYLVAYNSSLTELTLPDNYNGKNYAINPQAFYNCSGLTSVTIPDGVTSIEDYAFSGCTALTSVTIPDSVTSIGGWAFYDCTGLNSVTIGNGVTSIGYEAFSRCFGLTSVTIPDSVTSIGSSAFSDCTGLMAVTVADGNPVYPFLSSSSTASIVVPPGEQTASLSAAG